MLPFAVLSNRPDHRHSDIETLSQITPVLAPFYKFNISTSSDILCGPEHALNQLIARGCHLATKLWVDNHWIWILWKLAAMVALEPKKEAESATRRWCWNQVMNQFLYRSVCIFSQLVPSEAKCVHRYERELNMGVRPPLRQIATQDAPSGLPMTLVVSHIHIPEHSLEEGQEEGSAPRPELDVSDGWYKLRAEVDEPLARAIRRGTIRVGRKIVVSGAKVSRYPTRRRCV